MEILTNSRVRKTGDILADREKFSHDSQYQIQVQGPQNMVLPGSKELPPVTVASSFPTGPRLRCRHVSAGHRHVETDRQRETTTNSYLRADPFFRF